jgi:hypothetical protein
LARRSWGSSSVVGSQSSVVGRRILPFDSLRGLGAHSGAMRPLERLQFIVVALLIATPAYAQPFLYSVRWTPPCTPTGCAAQWIAITNVATGELVNADDPPLLGPDQGLINSMVTSPDGRRLFVAIGGPSIQDLARLGRLVVINLVTNRVETTVALGARVPWLLAADPAGRAVYGSNPLDGRITVFDGVTGQVTGEIRLPYPFAMALSADGNLMAVAEPQPEVVTVLDPRSGTVRSRVAVSGAPQRVAMSPDGTRGRGPPSRRSTPAPVSSGTPHRRRG